MQLHHLIAGSFLLSLLWAFLVLTRKSPDDAASGTLIGQVSLAEDALHHDPDGGCKPPAPWPARHFIVACSHCGRVTGSDGHPVRIGDTLRVSHGICSECAKEWEAEAARLTSAATAVPTT